MSPGRGSGYSQSLLRVAIIEDQREIREGLSILIGGTDGFEVTGAYSSMEAAIPAIAANLPEIALVDIGLPGKSGIEGIRILKEQHPGLLFLILTSYDDDARVFAAMCAGACGYLLKKTPPAKLLDGLQELRNGGAPMSPQIARQVVQLFRNVEPPRESGYRLTPAETRLLRLLVDGHSYKSAAYEMGVTVHAASFHARHVYEKLQVHSKSEAVARALKARLF
jgi:DNA-binding NarL/FixJ family response regulator